MYVCIIHTSVFKFARLFYSTLHLECRSFLISNLNLLSLFFNGAWQKRPRELEFRLRFEIEEMTLQMQWAVQKRKFRFACLRVFDKRSL